jgi:thioredoxin reductase (NADPH)
MYPIAFFDEPVRKLRKRGREFVAGLEGRLVRARTVILATGVTDHFPAVPDWETFVGRSLFWCIVCDGYSARGKRVVAVGNDDEAAVTALQFLQFTPSVTLVTNHSLCEVAAGHRRKCKQRGIDLVTGEITSFLGDDGILCEVVLADGRRLPADFVFSLQGGTPNNDLGKDAGAKANEGGYLVVDEDQHTSVPGLFAAGDVTHRHAHQVATAVHEGLTAATAVQYYLLEPWQR